MFLIHERHIAQPPHVLQPRSAPLRSISENSGMRHSRQLDLSPLRAPPRRHTNSSQWPELIVGLEGKDVARDGIEPPTRGFSVLCSTD